MFAFDSDEDRAALERIGSRIGYGRACQILGQLWDESLKRNGYPVGRGAMETGPTATFSYKLKASTGYSAKGEWAITAEQYGEVMRILSGNGVATQQQKERSLLPYLRQYRHNDGSEGFVLACEKEGTERVVAHLIATLRRLTDLAEGFNVSGVYFSESKENAEALAAADELLFVAACRGDIK